jgi:formylglycine-generating enzyme required for sulfatase activity
VRTNGLLFSGLLGACLLLAGNVLGSPGSDSLADSGDDAVTMQCPEPPQGMACIPGGAFVRGADNGPVDARPRATVSVGTFFIDINEVTVAEYEACVSAGRCPRAGPRYVGYREPRMPITGVSWFDAEAYCRAHGKRLPTEAEWEKAARGSDGRMHPWGDEPADCRRAVIRDASGRGCGRAKPGKNPDTGRPLPVGSRPAGIHGLFDMSGNSWEWVADWYSTSYAICGAACTGADPRGPCDGLPDCPGHRRKVVRGGSWYWPASYATAVYRRAHIPSNDPFHHFGFRCAADLDRAVSQ